MSPIKINKEIRNYTESVFFGLNLRQFVFSALACLIAVLFYFLFRRRFGVETVSWICILGALPMALFGFVRYHGMSLEQFLWTWLKSEFLLPKQLVSGSRNIYYQAFFPLIERMQKAKEEQEELPVSSEMDQPAPMADPDGSMPTTRLDKTMKGR